MSDYAFPEDVGALDELLMAGDASPTTRPIMTMVLVLDQNPSREALEATFHQAALQVPRMRQRVVSSAWTGRRPTWVDDSAFDVAHHITRVGAPGDGTFDEAMRYVSAGSTRPFDPARALWDAVVVERLADGRALLAIRAHHAIADGVRSVQMMAALLSFEPPDGEAPPAASEPFAHTLPFSGPTQLMRAMSRRYTANIVHGIRVSDLAVRLGTRPVATVSSAARYVRSAWRTVDSGQALPSPLLSDRSRSRQFVSLEMSLEPVKVAARSHGVTVNDVYLTALVGGLRTYHQRSGCPVTDIPLALPIDVAEGTPDAGNHISVAIIPGPSSFADPIARLHRVHDLVMSRRAEPGLGAVSKLAPVARFVPSVAAAAALHAHARRVDVQASNLIGPPFAVFLAGTKVERMLAFGPLPGVAVMAVLVSYDGMVTVGFTLDPAAVTDVDLFVECVGGAFAELLGAHP